MCVERTRNNRKWLSMTDETNDSNFSSWAVGWASFAGIMLIMVGIFDFIQGLVALFNDSFFVVTQEWVFEFDITAWGWIKLILGLTLIASGVGIFSGNVAGRTIGVIAAALAAIVNFAWLPYYPIWSIIIIALCVAIIWALTAHGRDIAA
jgi:hypothetical protein